MDREVLSADGFVCPHFRECRRSTRQEAHSFTEGQLSHVGMHYDLFKGRRPLRVVVVGQEYGAGHPLIDLDQRYSQILRSGRYLRYYADRVHPGRNPHMRGTTSALRLLFGNELNTDHEGEFIRTTDGLVHVFDAMALVNRLLYSAHVRGTSRGSATKTMRDNCLQHFDASLQVLQPTVMILQGLNVAKWIEPLFDESRRITDNLREVEIGAATILVSAFTHPSAQGAARWSDAVTSPYRSSSRTRLGDASAIASLAAASGASTLAPIPRTSAFLRS